MFSISTNGNFGDKVFPERLFSKKTWAQELDNLILWISQDPELFVEMFH